MTMADNVGTVYLDVKLNDKPVSGQIKSASKGWTSMFGKIGLAAGLALGARAAYGFAKSSIQLGSAISEVQNVVDVTFGQMSASINQWAIDASTAYGLSELNAKQYVGTMGAMLKSSGITGSAISQMSTDLVGLAGDMASFYNLDHDTAFQKIRSGISGETEPLKQLGINMSVANLEAFAMSRGITASYQAMDQASQSQLRYQYLLSVTSDQQGDFARTSNSWANQTRILTNQWESFKAAFGQGLINLFTPILRGINKVMAGLVALGNVFSKFTGALFGKQDMGTVAVQSGDAAAGMSELADETKAAGKAAKGALSGYDMLNVLSSGDSGSDSGAGGNFTGGVSGEWGENIEPEMKTGKIEKSAETIKRIFSGMSDGIRNIWNKHLQEPFAKLKTWVSTSIVPPIVETAKTIVFGWINAFTIMFNTLKTIFADFFQGFVNSLPALTESFGAVWNNINVMAQDALNFLFKILSDIWLDIGIIWKEHGQGIVDTVFGFLTDVFDIASNIFDKWIKPAFDEVMKYAKAIWNEHLRGIIQNVMGFLAELITVAGEIWNKFVYPVVSFLVTTFSPTFVKVFSTVGKIVKSVFGAIESIVSGVIRTLRGVINFIAGVFTGDWKRAWGGIKDIFGGIWDTIKGIALGVIDIIKSAFRGLFDVIKSLFSGIGNVLKAPINGAIDLINKAIRGMNNISIPSWVPGVGGRAINIPQIPKLAQGGIVSQPTLAMVGDNKRSAEVVAPLHTLMGMLEKAQGGGNTEMIRLLTELVMLMRAMRFPSEITMEGRQVAEVILEPLTETARRRQTAWPVRG
jgi:hypothetical protein